ncbi:MAG: lipopolysaccharide export system protein LptA [Gammaproteobacteria bacterium]|jgi:lipopolysaccharide export system protein LptA
MKLILLVNTLLVGILFAADTMALASDSEQPIEIQADFAELDDQEGKTIYLGNVVVTQGSIKMTGDKLRVNFAEDQELEDVFIEGRPAYFKQTPDSGDDVEGEGLLIEYHALKSLLHLIQKAKLTQGQRVFTGDRINYDTAKSVITAHGSPKQVNTVGQPPRKRERVRIIIPPKKKKPESP